MHNSGRAINRRSVPGRKRRIQTRERSVMSTPRDPFPASPGRYVAFVTAKENEGGRALSAGPLRSMVRARTSRRYRNPMNSVESVIPAHGTRARARAYAFTRDMAAREGSPIALPDASATLRSDANFISVVPDSPSRLLRGVINGQEIRGAFERVKSAPIRLSPCRWFINFTELLIVQLGAGPRAVRDSPFNSSFGTPCAWIGLRFQFRCAKPRESRQIANSNFLPARIAPESRIASGAWRQLYARDSIIREEENGRK